MGAFFLGTRNCYISAAEKLLRLLAIEGACVCSATRICASGVQDLWTFVEQLAQFLGVSCDKAQLEGLAESCNQLIEQCSNSEALSVCRGEYKRNLRNRK